MQVLITHILLLKIVFVLSYATQHGGMLPEITVLEKGGLTVTIPDGPGLEGFLFNANVNGPIKYGSMGEISEEAKRKHHGKWIVEDLEAGLKPGDEVHWWIIAEKSGQKYLDGGSFIVEGEEYSDDFEDQDFDG